MRLSRQLIVSTRPRTMRTVMSQKFVPVVSFEPGKVIDDADERLIGVELAERLEQLLFARLADRPRVGRRQDAAVHRHQVRREDHAHLMAAARGG